MKKCLFCGGEFEKLSKEHIIPNVICGRIKSKDLICTDCNSVLGQEIDDGVDGIYSHIINMFGIKRERGKTQPTIVTSVDDGKKYKYFSNGNYELAESYFKVKFDDNGRLEIHIEGPVDRNKLKGDIGKYLNSIKDELQLKKIDYKRAIIEAHNFIDSNWNKIINNKQSFRPNLIKFENLLGGKKEALVILKILYLYLKNEKKDIKFNETKLLNILKNKSDQIWDICYYYSLQEPLFEEPDDEISHQIFIRGNKSKKEIIGYIKLFSISPYVCVLDKDYKGENFTCTYGFNLLSQKEFQPICHEINETNNLDSLLNYSQNFNTVSDNAKKDYSRIFDLYYKLNPNKKWNEIQCAVYNKLKERLDVDLVDSPRIKQTIDILGEFRYHFTDKATDEDKDSIINDLTNEVIKIIQDDFIKYFLRKLTE